MFGQPCKRMGPGRQNNAKRTRQRIANSKHPDRTSNNVVQGALIKFETLLQFRAQALRMQETEEAEQGQEAERKRKDALERATIARLCCY